MPEYNSVNLPYEVASQIELYVNLGGQRNPEGLGGFLRTGLQAVELSCVDANWREFALTTKHLFILWNAYLDDVADTQKNGSLAKRMLALPFHRSWHRIKSKHTWLQAYNNLWLILQGRFRRFPNYAALADILAFDIAQFLNAIRYSCLYELQPCLANLLEHKLYVSHGMNVMLFATIDLLASPKFDMNELAN